MVATNIELSYTPQQNQIFFQTEDYRFIIVPKGRRFGATQGGMYAGIEWAIDGEPVLWGDTVNSNIDRYVERIAKPVLLKNKIAFNYQSNQKKLTFPFTDGYIDFRSADRPENWEGFGYKRIILNEAGIILKNEYLYTNAVLPMLIDHPDSRLYALGAPKGKVKKDKRQHKFYTLYLSAKNNEPGYLLLQYTSYDNPTLDKKSIDQLKEEIAKMNPVMVRQEIYAEFVDEVMDALWTPEIIRNVSHLPEMIRKVIAVDPSATKTGDEVGIGAAGKTQSGFCVFDDRSGNYSPAQWGKIVANMVKQHDADAIVIETNQGGEMAENIIRQFDPYTRIIKVHAVKAKQVRAEPVVSLYERGLVDHYGNLHGLENEMLTWVPGNGKSPNRIDWLVYAILELMGKENVSDPEKLKGVFF